jgi:Uma2 family endonuclease
MTGFSEEGARYDAPMTKAEFLRWVQGQEGRFELKDGRVIMQAGGTKRDSWIGANFIRAIGNRISPEAWAVGATDIAVEIGEDIRYPDVIVERRLDDGTALSTDRPVVLVEVASPSSEKTDTTLKLDEYTSLDSLECYIVASQKEPVVWVWQRTGADRAFPAKPAEIKGRDAAIGIPALAVSIPMAEFYLGISQV